MIEMSRTPESVPIKIRIVKGEAVWFELIVVAGDRCRIVETSHTMWWAEDLITWLECIACGQEACAMEVDGEGIIDVLESTPVGADFVRLVVRNPLDDDEVFIDAVVGRRELVTECYQAFRVYAENRPKVPPDIDDPCLSG